MALLFLLVQVAYTCWDCRKTRKRKFEDFKHLILLYTNFKKM